MTKIKVGDRVSVIDDNLEGIVENVENQTVFFTTDEGFTMQFPVEKVVVIGNILDTVNLRKPKEKFVKKTEKQDSKNPPVFDLHIEKLQVKHHHLSSAQKLEIQLNEVKRIIHRMKRKHYKEFILIHGEGKGVLRKEIEKILRQNGLKYTDAAYHEYGNGGILVIK